MKELIEFKKGEPQRS